MSKRQGIQLCYPFEEKRLAKWSPPYILQPKFDGDRCRAIISDKVWAATLQPEVTLLSSEENLYTSVPHINSALSKMGLRDIELDGELYIHGAPHNMIHSIVSRTENLHPDHQLVEFHVFDVVSHLPQVERIRQLIDLFPTSFRNRNFGPIQLVPSRIVNSLEEIMSAEDEFEKLGYEGFVVREATSPYVRKRSTSMMKFKPRKEDIYEIVSYQEEISISGSPKNSLGALVCRGDDGTNFRVGSGSLLTRDARENLWANREGLVGKYARIKYQHLTSARGVPRFPVIVEIVEPGTFME